MKKTLLIGLLSSAILALSLTGCKNNADPDNGTSPKILGAFFASSTGNSNASYDYVEENYKITELNLNRFSDWLVFAIEDPDHDFTEIQISPQSNFDINYHWDKMDYSTAEEQFWTSVRCGWNIEEEKKINYIQFNQPIYVRAIDKKGNISKTFTIENITITNTPYSGSAPKLNEIFCTNANPYNNGPFETWERLTTVNKTSSYSLVIDFHDPDFDANELHLSFDIINTESTRFTFNQKYEYQYSTWSDVKFSEFPTGNITFSAYISDNKGNKSNILTGELLIEE